MDETDLHGAARSPAFEEQEDDRYLIRSRTEIAALLENVSSRHALSRVSFNHGEEVVLTTLLHVDAAEDHVVFEQGPDAVSNQHLLEAERMIFVTQLDKIKIQFRIESVIEVDFDGAPAFLSPLPTTLLRLQRREFFRVAALASQPMLAEVLVDNDSGRLKFTMRGVDVSLGGVALLATSILDSVEAGDVFHNVQLTLPGVGPVTCDLEILNMRPQHNAGRLCSRFGCRFVNLTPAMSSRVQRYINRLELERAHRI
jgi:c-di-GMP-binding flagellar brake protein YcgR